jgi:hypothetical protein
MTSPVIKVLAAAVVLGAAACASSGADPEDVWGGGAATDPAQDDGANGAAPANGGAGGSSGGNGSSGGKGSNGGGGTADGGNGGNGGSADGSTGDASAAGDDPFDPGSCPGPGALSLSSKFAPGASVAVLGNYSLVIEKRSCTTATGCGPWAPSAKSAGPSAVGVAELVVQTSGAIVLVLVDNDCSSAYGTPKEQLGHKCTVATPGVSCAGSTYYATNIVEGAWPLKVGGTPGDKFSGAGIGELKGDIRPACLRLASDPVKVGTAVYDEYRAGLLVRY